MTEKFDPCWTKNTRDRRALRRDRYRVSAETRLEDPEESAEMKAGCMTLLGLLCIAEILEEKVFTR